MRTIDRIIICGLSLSVTVGVVSCAPRATRVADVWVTTRTDVIGAADRDMFATERASRLRAERSQLPSNEQRQEFLVSWRGTEAQFVKFEYRQVNVPDKVLVQTSPAGVHHSHLFAVRGDDFHNGGPVSAWRVSLWNAERLLAEKKSLLW